MENEGAAPNSPDVEPTKRRKLRKGTFSCIECKQRKVRCQPSQNGYACVPCRRRGIACLSQDLLDPISYPPLTYRAVEKSIDQVEDLVGQLLGGRQDKTERLPTPHRNAGSLHDCGPESLSLIAGLSASVSTGKGTGQSRESSGSANGTGKNVSGKRPRGHQRTMLSLPRSLDCSVSQELQAVFPNATEHALILNLGKLYGVPTKISRMRSDCSSVGRIAGKPAAIMRDGTMNPLFLARQLLELSISLQNIAVYDKSKLDRISIPAASADKFFEAATRLVTSRDSLLRSLEGLESLMLEASYLVHQGELQSAWLVIRRALSIAQLLGMPYAAWKTGEDNILAQGSAELAMWSRLVFTERIMSLMLGMPLFVTNAGFAADYVREGGRLGGRLTASLEQRHAVLMGRIIARNESIQNMEHGEVSAQGILDETQAIDTGFQLAAQEMPDDWWLVPDLTEKLAWKDASSRTEQVMYQGKHFHLIMLLHLPFLIEGQLQRFAAKLPTFFEALPCRYLYNKLRALEGARASLVRFLALRNSTELAMKSLPLDFEAFPAAVAILLAHIDDRSSTRASLLAHQRSDDLKLVVRTLESMDELSRMNREIPQGFADDVLTVLMRIESETVEGYQFAIAIDDGAFGKAQSFIDNSEDEVVRLGLPYFGVLTIKRRQWLC